MLIWKKVDGECDSYAKLPKRDKALCLCFRIRDKYICVEPGMATYWNEIPGKGKWDGQQVLKTL